MDTKRFLLAAILSLGVLILWQAWFGPPPGSSPEPAPAAGESEPASRVPESPPAGIEAAPFETEDVDPAADPAGPDVAPATAVEPLAAESEERRVVETPRFRAELTNRGGQILSFQLLEYEAAEGGVVDLVRARADGVYPLALVDPAGAGLPINDALFTVDSQAGAAGERIVTFRYRGAEGEVAKILRFPPDGLIELDVEARGVGEWGVLLGPGVRNPSVEEAKNRFVARAAAYSRGGKVERVLPQKLETSELVPAVGLEWIGLEDSYFLVAALPGDGLSAGRFDPFFWSAGPDETTAEFDRVPVDGVPDGQGKLPRAIGLVLDPAADALRVAMYWGPKELHRLNELPGGLERSVDFGMFGVIARPLLWGLRWIHANVVGNYGWAIVLMTLVIRILLFPLTHKSIVSMQKLQELNPKVQAIRQKFRGKLRTKEGRPNLDAQRQMNKEIQELYSKSGANPMGGCLPMLLQFPVFIAFYRLLSAAIELRSAPWALWIKDLAAPDPYYVLPIVMGASQLLQMKLSPSTGDPRQRRIMMIMPVFLTVLFLGFPSGLVLYWLTSNVLGIVQQVGYQKIQARREEATAAAADAAKKGPK